MTGAYAFSSYLRFSLSVSPSPSHTYTLVPFDTLPKQIRSRSTRIGRAIAKQQRDCHNNISSWVMCERTHKVRMCACVLAYEYFPLQLNDKKAHTHSIRYIAHSTFMQHVLFVRIARSART